MTARATLWELLTILGAIWGTGEAESVVGGEVNTRSFEIDRLMDSVFMSRYDCFV